MAGFTKARPRGFSSSGPAATAALAALAMLIASASFQPVLGAAKKPETYKPIVDNKAQLVPGPQLMPWIPRVNRGFKQVSTDLGSYALFDCPTNGNSTTGSCSFDTSPFSVEAAANPPPNTIIDYAEGIALWIAITVVGLVLVFVFMTYLILARYCMSKCCCKPNGCTCLRGGTPYPTRKQTCCGCGFILLKTGKLGYTKCDRWGARIYMLLFILCATALLVVAEFLGTQQVPTQTVDGADNAAGRVMTFTTRTQPAITEFIKQFGSTVLLPMLKTFNSSLTTAVDLSASYTALQCAQNMVLDLPDMATTSNILGTMMMLAPWMAGNITTIQTEVTNIGTIKTNVNTKAGLLKTDMQLYGGTKQPSLKRNILGIKGNISLIQTFQDSYCAASNGDTWKSNLNYFQRVTAGSGKIPLDTEFQQGGDDVNSVIVVGGATTRVVQYNNRGTVDTMNTRLIALYNDIKTLPDFRTIGNGLQAVLDAQTAMQQTTNATANLLYLFDNTPVVAGSAPTTASLKSKLDALSAEMANFNLDTMRSALVNVNNTINGLPDLDFMLVQFDKLQTVKDVLPCIKKLGDDLASINRTVIGIPGSFGGVADLYTTINATVSANLGSVETIRSNLGTTKTQIRSFATWQYIKDVDTAQSQVNLARGNLNVTDIETKLDTMETTFTTAFDFSAARASVLKFEAVVKDFHVDQTLIASLLDVQTKLDNLLPKLRQAVGNSTNAADDAYLYRVDPTLAMSQVRKGYYLLQAMGSCSTAVNIFCFQNTDCPGWASSETCATFETQGVSRCLGAPLKECTTDADCRAGSFGSTDTCTGDVSRATALRDALRALGTAVGHATVSSPAVVSAQQQQLTDVQAACARTDAQMDFTSVPTTMDNAQAKLAAVVVDQYASLVDALPAKLNAVDISNVNGVLTTAKSNVNSIDFTASKGQVDSLTTIIDDIRDDKADLIVAATSSVGALKVLMFQKWPTYQVRMQAIALQNMMNVGGPGAGLQELVGVPQDIINYLSDNVAFMTIPGVNFLNTTALYAEYLNRAFGGPGFKDTTTNGGIYYLSQLALKDSTIRATDPNARGIFIGKNGMNYPGDKMCLSKSCIKTTVDNLFNGPANAAQSENESVPLAPVPLSIRWLLLLLWAPIAIVVLFAIWALFSPACCRKPGWQKIPSAWVAGLSLCLMPFVMIISVLFFAAFMVAQDSCTSAQNVGANYIAASGQSLCSSTIGGNGDLNSCNLNLDSALASFGTKFNVSISVLEHYASSLGGCNPDNDPYTRLIDAAKPVVAAMPPKIVTYMMDGDLGSQLKIGAEIRTTIDSSAVQLGQALSALLTDLNRMSVKCSSVSTMTTGMQSDICYTLFTPFFWYMICWYLVGWVLLFCGFPAGMLGRKRLPNGLWGRGYEEFRGTEREEIKSRSLGKGSKSSAKVAPDSGVNVDDGVFRKSSSRSSSSKDKDKDKSKSPSRSSSSSKDKDKDKERSSSRSSSSKDKDRSSSKSSSSKDKDPGRSSSSSKDKERSSSKSGSSSSSKSPSKSSSSSKSGSSSSSSKDRGRSSSSSKDKERSSSSSKSPSKSSSSSSSKKR